MKGWVFLVGILLTTGALAQAADSKAPDAQTLGAGRALFLERCAACHGADAKGGGPVAASLKGPVADLTKLPQKNGVFDEARIRTSIDGTQTASAHGTREMPVWGKVLAKTGAKRSEGWAQADIWTLIQYLKSIQTPPVP
jgi:mono/diheme cytochrome c family protein